MDNNNNNNNNNSMINLRSFTMSLVFFITRNKLPPIALLVVCAEARLESLPFLLMRLAWKEITDLTCYNTIEIVWLVMNE